MCSSQPQTRSIPVLNEIKMRPSRLMRKPVTWPLCSQACSVVAPVVTTEPIKVSSGMEPVIRVMGKSGVELFE